jgi:hypothetical protein
MFVVMFVGIPSCNFHENQMQNKSYKQNHKMAEIIRNVSVSITVSPASTGIKKWHP